MQAVVSPGPNPLPAEVRLKYHPNDGDSFYGMDQELWLCDRIDKKVYTNRVQMNVRRLLEEAVILTFGMFHYEYEATPGLYIPTFGKPHQEVLPDIIHEVDERIRLIKSKEPDETFYSVVTAIGSGAIAEMCLDLTHTFRAGKNWNSHGAAVGAAVCDMAGLLSTLQNGTLPPNYRQTSLRGVPLGGQRHGSHNTQYVEYMTSQYESKGFMSRAENFLSHGHFRRNHHDAVVRRIFSEKMAVCDYPIPRPVRGHTVDFAATYMGTHVLDGECKAACTDVGPYSAVLVLHSLQQLTYRDTALAMLTTSRTFTLYSSTINTHNGRINTTYMKFPWYILDHPKCIDDDEFISEIPRPVGFLVRQNAGVAHANVDAVGSKVCAKWDKMMSGP